MIRPFDWRDFRLVKTLAHQGVCLDAQTGLTRGHHPLQTAVLDSLMPALGVITLVWRQADQAAFGQLRHRYGAGLARVLFVAPAPASDRAGWQPVVDQLAVQAGGRGAHNLIAEVDEAGPACGALRSAGYSLYARQNLWRLDPGAALPTPGLPLPLRAVTPADQPGVLALYTSVVPSLVQQIEPPPAHPHGLVLEQSGQLVALMSVHRGPRGVWLEPFLHPEADQLSEATLLTALRLLAAAEARPVYVCVRRYQDWLQSILQRAGLQPLGTQAVLAKRLTVRLAEPALKKLPAIEGQATTTPIAQARRLRRDRHPARPGGL